MSPERDYKEDASSSSKTGSFRTTARAHPFVPLLVYLVLSLLIPAALYLWRTDGTFTRTAGTFPRPVYHRNRTRVPESALVRPLFGRQEDGSVVRFDLVASIYFVHEGFKGEITTCPVKDDPTPPSKLTHPVKIPDTCWGDHQADDWDHKAEPQVEWETLFSGPVMRDLDETSTREEVVKIILPERALRKIRTAEYFSMDLVTTFHLVPSPL